VRKANVDSIQFEHFGCFEKRPSLWHLICIYDSPETDHFHHKDSSQSNSMHTLINTEAIISLPPFQTNQSINPFPESISPEKKKRKYVYQMIMIQ